MRRHGLQAPLDPHQLASWVVFFALVSGVYAFFMPFVEGAGTRWALVAVYSVLVIAITALDLYTSSLDPSDPGLKGATDGEFFCGLCQASVARSSKHCRACDRCVEGFDHHCKWLNNCVGSRNYWHFFGLISSTVSLLVLQLAWGLWLFIRSFTERQEMRIRVADKYGSSVVYEGWQAALAIYMALLITSVIMLGELLFFHIVLISKGMTTYDYIIAQRDAKLASPPTRSASGLKACRSSRVADTATAKRKVKVGINPFAAMRTRKPKGTPASWDAGQAKPLPGAAAASASSSSPLPPPLGKPGQLEAADSGSLASKEGLSLGLGLSDKAAAASPAPLAGPGPGTVQDMVARAVAEQTVPYQSGLREAALLRAASPAAGPGAGAAPGCVPECSTTASGGGAGGGAYAARDFMPLVQPEALSAMGLGAHAVAGGPQARPVAAVSAATAPALRSGLPGAQQQLQQQRQQRPQHRLGTMGSPGSAPGLGPGSASTAAVGAPRPPPAVVMADSGSPKGFDAAAAPGRHLGGLSASPASAQTCSGDGASSSGLSRMPSRPNSLPPLRGAPALPLGQTPPGSLYPGKLPPAGGSGSRRDSVATPE